MAKRGFRFKLSKFKLRWLKKQKTSRNAQVLKRGLKVEALEARQLMAVDGWDGADDGNFNQATGLFAEGEAANDLVDFAKKIGQSGAKMYGAVWCPVCNQQKALFEDGGKYLPFIEVTNPDRSLNSVGTSKNITTYPTWEFADGSRLTGLVSLATLSQKTGVAIPQSSKPSFDTITNKTVLIGSPLHVPVDAYDPNGNPLTITVSSSNPALVTAEVLQGSRSLKMNVDGWGDMVFELFEQEAPRPTGRLIDLSQSGFYDNVGTNKVTFHRVVNGFVIQAGDPSGTGAGGSTLGDFDDQYNVNLQHNQTGVLSFAKSQNDDSNDSQFYITEGPTRDLDFNYSVSGQLVEGDSIREGISNVPVKTVGSQQNIPVNEVVIKSMSVFSDTENGLIRLKAASNLTGSATITVTVTDTEGNSVSQAFVATVAQDTFNSAPFLNPLATSFRTNRNTPVVVQLASQDVEGDAPFYDATAVGATGATVTPNNTTGAITITPPTDFVGSFDVVVGVRQNTAANTVDPFDKQTITINVAPTAPTAIDLISASDTGSSDSDNITNSGNLSLLVTGTQAGALVELRLGTTVVGTATATGANTTVSTNNIAALGSGNYTLTATQTLSGIRSDNSPSLQITYDATEPEVLLSSLIPSTGNVGTPININLTHPEEGQGLIYGLQTAPTGMTLNSSTGVLNWTPVTTQIGVQQFSITLTDIAGNTRVQTFSINIGDTAQVGFRLAAVSDSGTPLSSLQIGQTFKLQVYTKDLRDNAEGVFSAYLDLLYNNGLVELVGTSPVAFKNPYTNTPSSNTSLAGVINEMGAFASSMSPLGADEKLFAEISMRAISTGSALFRTDPAEDVNSNVSVYGIDTPINTLRVNYGTLTLPIALSFQVNPDTFNVDEDSSNNTLNVLANDTVQGATVLTIKSVGPLSSGGTATISADQKSIRYTPAPDFNGSESFSYTAKDQNGAESTSTVSVQVTAINDSPVANPDTISVVKNSTNNIINVLANDTMGPDTGETLKVLSVGTPSQGGTASVANGGLNINYAPKNNFVGTETVSYTLSDGKGGTATGTITVTINDNPPPTAVNDTASIVQNGAEITIDAIANDSTSDSGETISISAVGTPDKGGTASLDSNGKVRYRPANNFVGTENISYTLRDSRGATATGLIVVTVNSNPPPTAVNDTATVVEDGDEITIDAIANDSTSDSGETISISAVGTPNKGGTSSLGNDGKVRYRPAANFSGTETITYTLRDSRGATTTGTIVVTVTAVNDAPVANDDTEQVLTGTTARTVSVLSNDTDVDTGDVLTITAVTQPASGKGTVAISTDKRSILYTPPSETFTGEVIFSYTLSDSQNATDTATVKLNVVDFTPRTIGGMIASSFDASKNNGISGFAIKLEGVDQFGSNIQKNTQSSLNGSYQFTDLAPGQYKITKNPLSFLNDTAKQINVQSQLQDGNSLNNNITVGGGLKAAHLDVRDFLGNTSKRKMTVAVAPGSTQQWFHSRSGWDGLSNLSVQLNSAGNELVIRGSNSSNQLVETRLPVSDPRVEKRGNENGTKLFHLNTASSGLTFTPVAANSNESSGPSGEGEGPSTILATAKAVSKAADLGSVNSSNLAVATAPTLSAPTIKIDLRSTLGSSYETNATAGSSAAVDTAFEKFSPSLKLSPELENMLAAAQSQEQYEKATDKLLGNT
jgi:cyclophilin family peptidyl-prolyl cis-trans isomerase